MSSQTVGFKLVILEGPSKSIFQEYPLKQNEPIILGRKDELKGSFPDIDFRNDPGVSRPQARLFWEENERARGWFLEDLQDRNPTKINGRALQGKSGLITGETIQMGSTVLTLLPENWFHFYSNRILIAGDHYQRLNYGFLCSKLKFFRKLIFVNTTEQQSLPFPIMIRIQGYSQPCRLEIPSLGPYERHELKQFVLPDLELIPEPFREITEEKAAHLSISSEKNNHYTHDIRIFSPYDWSYELYKPESVSVYIPSRENPLIKTIVNEAEMKPEPVPKRADPTGKKAAIVHRIYDCLKDNGAIRYEHPALKSDNLQTIRPPHHIFDSSSIHRLGRGTCLDLTLLMAGCLMSVEIDPVIIFAGREEGIPLHVFLGFWPGHTCGTSRTLLSAKEMQVLAMVECTGLAAGNSVAGDKLSFAEAMATAGKIFEESLWKCGVNIRPTREKPWEMVSLNYEYEPVVARIYQATAEFAKSKRKNKLETIYLFYALLKTSGEITVQIFTTAGIDAGKREEIIQDIDKWITPGVSTDEPKPTTSYTHILDTARDFADQMDSLTVREQDLLYALFSSYKVSNTLRQCFEKHQIEPNRLLAILNQTHPDPQYLSSIHGGNIENGNP